VFNFLLPFLTRQPVIVCGFPTYCPHPKNQPSRNDERGAKLLLIDLRSMTANLTTWFSGSQEMSP